MTPSDIIGRALAGDEVVVILPTARHLANAFDTLAREALAQPGAIVGLRRIQGAERITTGSGGVVRFTTTGQAYRMLRGSRPALVVNEGGIAYDLLLLARSVAQEVRLA
jgi:hypothetical protein